MKSIVLSEKPRIKFILGDRMEYMKGLPDKAFDLAIVDPPYGIGADKFNNGHGAPSQKGDSTTSKIKNRLNSGGGKLKNRMLNNSNASWDIAPSLEYFENLKTVSENQIIWGGNYFPLPPSRCILVWDKIQPWENFSQVELAWTSFDSPAQIFQYRNNGFNDSQGMRIHPTQKPVELYKWLLNKYAKQGDRILDTHGGSFSSVIACYYAKHDFVGIELNEDYFNKVVERFQKETRQTTIMDLF